MGSVAIFHNDSIVYSKAVGYADVQNNTVTNLDTKFRIGSLTKTFTAALVLKAIEENKLKLNDFLSQFYPQVKNSDRITIEHLLKHRSGIFNFTEIEGEEEWEQQYHTEDEFMAFFSSKKGNFEPGTSYSYSNTNYALLGFILQKVYKKPFAGILNEKLSEPLGLQNTYYSFKVDPTKNETLSYNIQDKYVRNGNVNFSNHPGSGGLVSTPKDLNRFLYCLFENKVINNQSLKVMLPIKKGEYGMGIEKLDFDSPSGFTHTGRIENYYSSYWYFPKEQLGVVTLANATNINVGTINEMLVKYAYGMKLEVPDFQKILGLSSTQGAKILGTYLSDNKKNTVTISSDGEKLVFQSSIEGQEYVSFEYHGNNIFQLGNVTLTFFPDNNRMELIQDDIKQTYVKILN